MTTTQVFTANAVDVLSFGLTAAAISKIIRRGGKPDRNEIPPGNIQNYRREIVDAARNHLGDLNRLSSAELDELSSLSVVLVIDSDLLDAFIQRVKECIGKHASGVRYSRNSDEIVARNREAKNCVCAMLNDIMEFNDGELPGEYLKTAWKSYGCVR